MLGRESIFVYVGEGVMAWVLLWTFDFSNETLGHWSITGTLDCDCCEVSSLFIFLSPTTSIVIFLNHVTRRYSGP